MKVKSLLTSLFMSAVALTSANAQFSDDVGVNTILSPNINGNICAGYNDLIIKVSNYGDNNVTSFDIGWSLDNVPQGSQTVNTVLNSYNQPNSTININLGLFTLQYNVPTLLKAWTYNPNATNDSRTSNDTFSITITASDSGITMIDMVDTYVCYNGSLVLDVGYSPYTDYTWSNGNQAQTNTITTPGQHWVWAYSSQGCQAFDTFMVEGIEEPAATNMTISDLGNLTFNFMLSNLINTENVTWDFGDGSPLASGLGAQSHTYAAEGSYEVIATLENRCGSIQIKQTIQVREVLSINNLKELKEAFNFYPNPARNYLNVTYPKNLVKLKAVSIINTTGQTVLYTDNPDDVLDISNIPAGMYQIVLSTDKGITSKKIDILK